MIIRLAKQEDIEDLINMWKKLSDFHKNFPDYMTPSLGWKNMMRQLYEEDLISSSRAIFIAKDYYKSAGFLRVESRVNSRIFATSIIGYISDIYVEEQYRGTNVAEKLFAEGINWFRSKGIYSVRLNVNPENTRAINFYNKLGFKEVNKTLSMAIDV